MTGEDLELLKASVDQVVTLEMTDGERHLARVLFVFAEGETPDCFYLRVQPGPEGGFVQQGSGGFSMLLSEIAGVYPVES